MHFTLEVLSNTRKFYNKFLEKTSLDDLNKIPQGFNNNIIWNIGHIVVTQQLLAYKLSGLPMMVSDSMIAKYMNPVGLVMLIPAAIATMSTVNTFTHLHIPLYVSLLRSFHSIVLGLIIGYVFILIYKLGYSLYLKKIKPRWFS